MKNILIFALILAFPVTSAVATAPVPPANGGYQAGWGMNPYKNMKNPLRVH